MMNEGFNDDWEARVDDQDAPSHAIAESAVMQTASTSLCGKESRPEADQLIDLEFVEYCSREGDDTITLEEVREATSKIPGSMAQFIIEEERAERF